MRIGKWALLFLAALPLLSGCDHFWDVPPSSSGGSGGGGTASGVFYVINQTTPEIRGYSIAANATTLTAVSGSPVSLSGIVPIAMTISPNGGLLYVSTQSGIFGYAIDGSTGKLTALNGGTAIVSGVQASWMQVDSSGSWLVYASPVSITDYSLTALPIVATTGLQSPTPSPQTIDLHSSAAPQLAMTSSTATDPYVFVALQSGGFAIVPFTYTSSTPLGTITGKAALKTGGSDLAVAVDSNHSLLYVGESGALTGNNAGGLRVFTIGANSTLTEFTDTSYPYSTAGVGPSAILVTSSYVYVANKSVSGSNTGNISSFAINTSGGVASSLTFEKTVVTGDSTVGLAEDSTGVYLLAVNSGGNHDLNVFTFGTGGALTSYTTASVGSDPTQTVAIAAK